MTRRNNNSNIIFIMGPPRSGTSWTWSLLSSLPNFEPVLREDFDSYDFSKSSIKRMRDESGFNTTESAIFFSNLSDSEIVQGVKAKLTALSKDAYIFEKTPSNTLVLPRILEVFPEARFIYLQRDPRATISSMLHTKLSSGHVIARDVDHAINIYRQHHEAIRPHIGKHNFYVLKYESLYNDPVGEFTNLLRFIVGNNMMPDTSDIEAAVANNAGKLQNVKINAFRVGGIDHYKKELKKDDLEKIESGLSSVMRESGYRSSSLFRRFGLGLGQ